MTPIWKPPTGVAVLACRCGRVLNAADMHRVHQPRTPGSAPAIERIVCARCANRINQEKRP